MACGGGAGGGKEGGEERDSPCNLNTGTNDGGSGNLAGSGVDVDALGGEGIAVGGVVWRLDEKASGADTGDDAGGLDLLADVGRGNLGGERLDPLDVVDGNGGKGLVDGEGNGSSGRAELAVRNSDWECEDSAGGRNG